MADSKIGASLNAVTIDYATGADVEVKEPLVTLLKAIVKPAVATGQTLTKVFISATTNGTHSATSRHATKQAVDISRINGKYISTSYDSDAEVKAICDALQDEADKQTGIRENFGPKFTHKNKTHWTVDAHDDHIHLSVD